MRWLGVTQPSGRVTNLTVRQDTGRAVDARRNPASRLLSETRQADFVREPGKQASFGNPANRLR